MSYDDIEISPDLIAFRHISAVKITSLPVELLNNVFQTITDKKDLINLMVSCKLFTRLAEQVLWEVCNTKGYVKLKMKSEDRDTFARWIRDQRITFEENSFRPAELTLHLPQLRVLHVYAFDLFTPSGLSSVLA
jgi:hypothetical protein